jgi:8-oxo-dGTP pyrophosphatase MutT (NUDIX family)
MADAAADPERFAVPFVKALVVSPGSGRFLLQRRSKRGDPYEGFWELPGGKMRHGETAEEALRREIREEAGLRLRRVLVQPDESVTDRFSRTARALAPLAVVEVLSGPWPFLGLYFAVEAEGEPGTTEEGSAHRYVTPEEFRAEFLDPGAIGECATLDVAAMRRILAEGRLEGIL